MPGDTTATESGLQQLTTASSQPADELRIDLDLWRDIVETAISSSKRLAVDDNDNDL